MTLLSVKVSTFFLSGVNILTWFLILSWRQRIMLYGNKSYDLFFTLSYRYITYVNKYFLRSVFSSPSNCWHLYNLDTWWFSMWLASYIIDLGLGNIMLSSNWPHRRNKFNDLVISLSSYCGIETIFPGKKKWTINDSFHCTVLCLLNNSLSPLGAIWLKRTHVMSPCGPTIVQQLRQSGLMVIWTVSQL